MAAIIAGGMGSFARIATQSAALKTQVELLSRQVSDGRRATVYGDEAPQARQAIGLRGEIARRGAYASALDQALGRADTAQQVLTRLGSIAGGMKAEALRLATLAPAGEAEVLSVAGAARAALEEVAGLLNTQHMGEYLFGGSDSASPPVPDAAGIATGPMASAIAAAVAGLTPTNAAAVATQTAAAATDTTPGASPFSAWLEDPAGGGAEAPRSLLAEDGGRVGYGLLANRNAQAVSTGETVGSWARDLLRGLATLAALTTDQAAQGEGFQALMSTVQAGLDSASTALSLEGAGLGQSEQRLATLKERHADASIALKQQLAGIEEVDDETTILALQETRQRLEASWKALTMLSELTLTRFLS
ncbi:hypothetical protein LPC08_20115 [Roseomonas sp. OT10]|uniref:hypothetical protein n=1 Tax=Roseomonas cutis TaxID=2897332 RepID=UPI001E5B48C6|nr:hypothetical protein [Roseomonas sp. OT10]UFN48294.1 hypothetical protein LPC08_20115 [Roseomonas sp. OT10]